MSLLPRAVSPDSPNSRQHRNALANAVNAIIKRLGAFAMADVTDYQSGSWTPADASGAGLVFTVVEGKWWRIGNLCFANMHIIYPTTSNGSFASVGGLPFAVPGALSDRQAGLTYTDNTLIAYAVPNGSGNKTLSFYGPAGGQGTNANMSGHTIFAQFIYPIS